MFNSRFVINILQHLLCQYNTYHHYFALLSPVARYRCGDLLTFSERTFWNEAFCNFECFASRLRLAALNEYRITPPTAWDPTNAAIHSLRFLVRMNESSGLCKMYHCAPCMTWPITCKSFPLCLPYCFRNDISPTRFYANNLHSTNVSFPALFELWPLQFVALAPWTQGKKGKQANATVIATISLKVQNNKSSPPEIQQ
jgi:hypothetical protein